MIKGLQALKDFREHYIFELDEEENLNAIEKSLMALQIIKDKEIDVGELMDVFKENEISLDEYNDGIARFPITLEQYELLKEVLGVKHA